MNLTKGVDGTETVESRKLNQTMVLKTTIKGIPGTLKLLRHRRFIQLICLCLSLLLLAHIAVKSYLVNDVREIGRACTVAEHKATKDDGCICYANQSGDVITRSSLPKDTDQLSCAFTVHPQGRLGNLMGEYATLYALAKMNNRPAFVPMEMAIVLKRYFKVSLPILPERLEAALRDKWKMYELYDWMEDRHRNISGTFVMLDGYPCSWTFYHHIRDEIIQEFSFHKKIQQDAASYLTNVKGHRNSVTFVGVHVRRGDYVKLMAGSYQGVVADKEFFQKAMAYFRGKFHDAMFIVSSDDMDWCKKNIGNDKGDVHFAGNGDGNEPIRDFAILASCNHSIITIGTYGFWTAYLAGGETIYLVNYTNPNSVFMKYLKYDKAYLPEWIGIPANLPQISKAISISICRSFSLIVIVYVEIVYNLLISMFSLR